MNETPEKHTHYHIGARSPAPFTSTFHVVMIVLSVMIIFFITAPLIGRWLQSPVEPLNAHVMLDSRELARVQQTPINQLMEKVMQAHFVLKKSMLNEAILKQKLDEGRHAISVKEIFHEQKNTQKAFMDESRTLDQLAYRLSHSKKNSQTQDRRDAHDHS